MSPKRHAVLLSGSIGMGHDQLAESCASALHDEGWSTEKLDLMKLLGRGADSIGDKVFRTMLSLPGLYDAFHFAVLREGNRLARLADVAARRQIVPRLRHRLDASPPELVMSVFATGASAMSALASRYPDTRHVVFSTDVTPHRLWVHSHVDLYLVTSEPAERAVRRYSPEARVQVIQAPVRDAFYRPRSQSSARERFEVPAEERCVLLTTGAWGLGPVAEAAEALGEAGVHVLAVAGKPPAVLKQSGHALTIYPFLFRHPAHMPYRRERIDTPDGDFLDIDWMCGERTRVAVICHGLEGSSRSNYVRGMAKALVDQGWDVVAMNFRGCSGEANRTARMYHSGATEDLDTVLRRVLDEPKYRVVALIGFSIGGNLVLKYLGEQGTSVDPRIQCAVTFSVPCDLASSADRLDRLSNRLYRTDFTLTMTRKLKAKATRYPALQDTLRAALDARGFDAVYTAPYHGFDSAEEYYRRCSSKAYLAQVAVPTLVVNALDDPMLAPVSFPIDEARFHPYVHLETPRHGGHIGFVSINPEGRYWSETRTLEFLNETLRPQESLTEAA